MSTERVTSAIRDCIASRSAVRISGRGGWLDAGRPVRAENTLSLGGDTGVVSYVPGDLTLTVRAGTTLAEITEITAEHDQWLPLDPYGSLDGTIGATIATASAGPLASSFGLPRDLLLGLEFVNGRGETVRAGGKVVKNVAGFDLSRLLAGSWGTLGVITEVTLRLYARPQVDRTFIVPLAGTATESSAFLRAFLSAPFSAYAFELLNSFAAQALELGTTPVCLVRFGGSTAAVDAQIRTLSQLARAEETDVSKWQHLRALERGSGCVIRVSGLPAQFRSVAGTILADSHPRFFTYINPLRGMLRLVERPSQNDASTSQSELGLGTEPPPSGSVVYETLPAEVWSEVSPSVTADPLSRGIKKAYDPFGILNPGILGD
ncbi:MAG: FAD-binding oxidoreductase [Gemmatimonadaceae bacterium]